MPTRLDSGWFKRVKEVVMVKAAIFCLLCIALSTEVVTAEEGQFIGVYRNFAEGYSIKIPRGLRGDAGPGVTQRGVSISLPSGGVLSVWGEPNSLEWRGPSDGVQSRLEDGECASGKAASGKAGPSNVVIGRIAGAQGTLACGNAVEIMFLAFRPGGGPIYWLMLTSSPAHESEDKAILEKVAATFRIIRWR
jgi:hypothetical protein